MKQRKRQPATGAVRRRLVLAGLLGSAVACTGPAPLEAVTLLQHGQCQALPEGVRLIGYAELAKLRGNSLLSMTDGDDTASGPGEARDPLLVAVSRGPQPTAGYALALDSATLDTGTASLHVRWQTPPTDSLQAQVITHPCLVVGLPRAPVKRVRVVDQSGTVIGELTVETPLADEPGGR